MFATTITRAGRGTVRALCRPWVSIALITMMLMDTCSLPESTTIGRIAPTPRIRCCCFQWPEALVVQSENGLHLIDQYDDVAANVDSRSVIATIRGSPFERNGGFWAVTRAWWDPSIRVYPETRNLTISELAELRPQFADIVERGGWSSLDHYADLVRSGSGPLTRIVWHGYVHNAFSATLAAAMILSFGWVRERMTTRRYRALLACGCCPVCRYDLRSQIQAGCPECGWRRETAV